MSHMHTCAIVEVDAQIVVDGCHRFVYTTSLSIHFSSLFKCSQFLIFRFFTLCYIKSYNISYQKAVKKKNNK